MSYAKQMLDTYEPASDLDAGVLAATIDALSDCAVACTLDADANLGEQDSAEMVRCIALCLNCADLCTATLAVTGRRTASEKSVTEPLLEACEAICRSCGDECARHAGMHPHCRICEVACRRCEQACRELLAAIR
jgi:hypothetical protein